MPRRLVKGYLNGLLFLAIVSFFIFVWITSKIPGQDVEKLWRTRYSFTETPQNNHFAEQPKYNGIRKNPVTVERYRGIIRINLNEMLQSVRQIIIKPSSDQESKEVKTINGQEEALQGRTERVVSGNNKPKEMIVQGFLERHIWFDICSWRIDSLRNFLLFPIAPGFRGKTTIVNVSSTATNYGQRLFGYLRPLTSNTYIFKILSRGGVELWLSSDENPKNVRMVGKDKKSTEHVDSKESKQSRHDLPLSVELKSNKFYYIEMLHKHGNSKRDNSLTVLWKNLDETNFSPIPSSCLFSSKNNLRRITNFQYRDTKTMSYARDVRSPQGPNKEKEVHIEPIREDIVNDVLRTCPYRPSYLIHYKLVRFQGARNKSNTRFLRIYPMDSSNESLALVKGEKWWEENAIGNHVLDRGVAADITKIFMEAFEKRHPGKFELQQIMNIRTTSDKRKGDRFFLNLRIKDKTSNSTKVFLRYVYRPKHGAVLCYPENFRWNPQAVIHLVVPVKDCSAWILALVKNIEEILSSSPSDPNINLVLVDYSSKDIDIQQILQESSIEHFQVVTLPGNESFRRAVALQRAADTVQDPHSILFFTDLHLSIPGTLFPLIRQHCVEGKMAFAPVVKRLRCGSYPSVPYGYWETLGFGLFAIYKTDFQRVGGMDVNNFKQWGGEDWELLDRVLMAGIEVERIKVPGFYHFYHRALGAEGNSRHNA